MQTRKLVIIGSGPAGYTAAIYAARAMLKPLLFEGFQAGLSGGQLMTTTEVENFPGFPHGVLGPELMQLFRSQAERFGTDIVSEDIISIDCSSRPFVVQSTSQTIQADSIIIATGATAKRLDIPGTKDDELWQRGVSACAVCDGAMPLFRNKELFVIGGGDSAVEEALFLTRFASKVYIVHRRDTLRASKIMTDRALQHPKIEVLWNSVIEEVQGEKVVSSVRVKNVVTNQLQNMPASGVFFAVGHVPNTAFLKNQIELLDTGYIKVEPGTTKTSIRGIYAAGDVQDHMYRQAITACGTGCMAALEAERDLMLVELQEQ